MIRESRHMKAAIVFFALFALCMPALADLAAGKQALQNGDYATALKEFLPLAEQGDAEAQCNLGFMYATGHGVPQDDKKPCAGTVWQRSKDSRMGSSTSASCMALATVFRGT